MKMQMDLEDYFYKLASIQKKDVIIISDRGVMDNLAYCTKKTAEGVFKKNGWSKNDIRDKRYDIVIHLVTAADGAEKFYTLENNEARSEGIKEAIILDQKTQSVWNGHPNHRLILY